MNRFFCSLSSRARSEPLYGTAPRVRSWLLVEYPGVWHPEAMEESTLADSAKQKLIQLEQTESFHRQLFIRQTHRRSETTRCFVVRSLETDPYITQVDVPTCDGPITALDHPDARPVTDPMFLVCTHGNHDKCCAKFGLPVFYTLRNIVEDQAWQCSHVGGDRFAGNLLCFPHGIYYGHVTPEDVPRLVDSYRQRRIDLKHYRGRCCYSKGVQVAEYFVRAESGLLGIDDLKLDIAIKGDPWVVRFRGPAGMYEVAFRVREGAQQMLTCKAQRPNPIPQFEFMRFRFHAQVTLEGL